MTDKMVLVVGAAVGFFLVPPLARANPAVVNGFLLLVLFSSLLLNRDRWLPYLSQLSGAYGSNQSGGVGQVGSGSTATGSGRIGIGVNRK
jgi:hypothetical protein